MNAQFVVILVMVCALTTLVCSALLSLGILRLPAGNASLPEVASAMQTGVLSCLHRQTQTQAFAGAGFFLLLWAVLDGFRLPYTALCFALAAVFSALISRVSLHLSLRMQLRPAPARSLGRVLEVVFQGGAVTGLAIMGLSLLGIAACVWMYTALGLELEHLLKALIGYGFGASLSSFLARVSGSIYTQAVGTMSLTAPWQARQLAAQFAARLGDGAGLAADLFESYGLTLIVTMFLGFLAFQGSERLIQAVLFPLALAAAAMLAVLVAIWFVRLPAGSTRVMGAIYQGLAAAALLSALAFFLISRSCFSEHAMGFYLAALVGPGLMLALSLSTEYATSIRFQPVKLVSEQSRTGVVAYLIRGLAVGFESTLIPTLLLCAALLAAYWLAKGNASSPLLGMYGVAVAATALVSGAGMMVALAAFAPDSGPTSGFGLPEEMNEALQTVAHTVQAISRSYALTAAGLAALLLFVSYTQQVSVVRAGLNLEPVAWLLSEPRVLAGLLFGAMLPCCFLALVLKAGFKTGERLAAVQDQPADTAASEPGVEDLIQRALQGSLLPVLLAVGLPVLVGWSLGPLVLGALLVGATLTGWLLALLTNLLGASWGNARKYVELGYFGGKGSQAHQVVLAGDAVGILCKDTLSPVLNSWLKMINLISLLMVSRIAGGSLLGL